MPRQPSLFSSRPPCRPSVQRPWSHGPAFFPGQGPQGGVLGPPAQAQARKQGAARCVSSPPDSSLPGMRPRGLCPWGPASGGPCGRSLPRRACPWPRPAVPSRPAGRSPAPRGCRGHGAARHGLPHPDAPCWSRQRRPPRPARRPWPPPRRPWRPAPPPPPRKPGPRAAAAAGACWSPAPPRTSSPPRSVPGPHPCAGCAGAAPRRLRSGRGLPAPRVSRGTSSGRGHWSPAAGPRRRDPGGSSPCRSLQGASPGGSVPPHRGRSRAWPATSCGPRRPAAGHGHSPAVWRRAPARRGRDRQAWGKAPTGAPPCRPWA